jgi:hypothetical protein
VLLLLLLLAVEQPETEPAVRVSFEPARQRERKPREQGL